MRVLALDYGRARCGCAVSDPTGVLASPVEAVRAPTTRRGLARLRTLVAELEIERVVVGLPLSLSGRDSAQTTETRAFAARLEQELPVPVELYDERFTTRLAERTGGRADEDSRAAAHLLESWLASQPAWMGRRAPARSAGGPEVPDGSERTADAIAEERDGATRTAPARAAAGRTARRRAGRRRRGGGRRARRASRKWGGRFVAVLALALAGGAIWFLVELYQPFHGSPHGQRHGHDPAAFDLRVRSATSSRAPAWSPRASSSTCARRSPASAATCAPAPTTSSTDMTYSKVLKVLTTAPVGAADDQHHDHRGPDSRPDQRSAEGAGRQGQLLRRDPSLAADQLRRLRRAAAHAGPRGVPVPGHLPAGRADQHPGAREPIS